MHHEFISVVGHRSFETFKTPMDHSSSQVISLTNQDLKLICMVRATSHMRLRAHDHYTSSTLIWEKAEQVQVHFTLITVEGPTEYVNARWM